MVFIQVMSKNNLCYFVKGIGVKLVKYGLEINNSFKKNIFINIIHEEVSSIDHVNLLPLFPNTHLLC